MIVEPVLVTGAAGFLGTALSARLRAQGLRVIDVVRKQPATPAEDVVACDLRELGAVEDLFRRHAPATVFDLASRVTGARDLDAVHATFHETLGLSVNVLMAAAKFGTKRVVQAGSAETLPDHLPPRYPYAAAKRAAAEYAALFHASYGLPTSTARIGMVYGPGQRAYKRLVPYVITSQLQGQRPQLSSGARAVDSIYIDNLVDALLAMAAPEAVAGKVLDVGTGLATSIADVARIITELTGGPAPELGAVAARSLDEDFVLDAEATARALGWRSRVDLTEGLRRSITWYRSELAAGRV